MLPMLMLMKAELLKQANFKQIILYTDDGTDLLVGDTNDLFAEIRPMNNLGLSFSYSAANDLLGSLAKALET